MSSQANKMSNTDLSGYDNSWYQPKASILTRTLWHFTNHLFFTHGLFPFSSLKVLLLKLFGSTVGKGVNVKPVVNIKYPWLLNVGNNVWIGEGVWIDNLAKVSIGDNVCLSQGAMLLTGNHNYRKSSFDLMIGGIRLEEGVWIGAKSIVCPGVVCHSHSVLSVHSVATNDLDAYTIYQGNPARKVKDREIKD